MNRYKIQVIGIITALLLAGCSIPTKARLYNNSGVALNIIQESSARDRREFKVPPNEIVDLEYWEIDSFTVFANEKVWNYSPPLLSAGFVKSYGWGIFVERVVKIQIEPDGRIFALKPRQNFPATDFAEQPKDFPLKGGEH